MNAVVRYLLILAVCLPAAAEFEAGVGTADITPETGEVMWGYTARTAPAEGALDRLYARAVTFRAAETTLAVVALDLGRPPLPDVCKRIRERALTAGVDDVIFAASHTHQAPAVDVNAPYMDHVEKRIGDAVLAAAESLAPARIGVGRTTIDIAHNRRLVLDDGSVRMAWRNEDKIPLGPVDKEAGVIRIDDAAGNLRAAIVNYACHPVVLGMDHKQYSADWAGAMAALVKAETGAECIFLNGACGDINPYMDKTPVDAGGVNTMRAVGREAGGAVLDVLPEIATAAPENPAVEYRRHRLDVGLRWDKSNPENEKVLRGVYGPLYERYIKPLPQNLSIPLATVVLNDNLALACMPGEIFVQYQLDLKAKSPVDDAFLVGYADEYHAYFPTIKAASEGGYGASVQTYVGVGAADALLTQTLLDIGQLSGTIRDPLELRDFILKEAEPDDLP